MFRIAKIVAVSLLLSPVAFADGHGWGHHHHHHRHGHHHDYYPRYREEIVYVPERVVEYVPAPRYYAPPPPPPPPPSYYGYDQRKPTGLVGGMVGSVMGYEMGRGDPLAAGIGAAAGAWLGNGMY